MQNLSTPLLLLMEETKFMTTAPLWFQMNEKKKYFFIQPSTKIETLLATLTDKEPVIQKSHLSGANVRKGLKQIRTWTFLL